MKIQKFLDKFFGELTVLKKDDGTLWFICREICEKLNHDMSNISRYVLEEDRQRITLGELPLELVLTTSLTGKTMMLVSEAGMYDLIFSSRKPEARAFQRWVTHTVLPSVRENGVYAEEQEEMSDREQNTLFAEILKLTDKIRYNNDKNSAMLEVERKQLLDCLNILSEIAGGIRL